MPDTAFQGYWSSQGPWRDLSREDIYESGVNFLNGYRQGLEIQGDYCEESSRAEMHDSKRKGDLTQWTGKGIQKKFKEIKISLKKCFNYLTGKPEVGWLNQRFTHDTKTLVLSVSFFVFKCFYLFILRKREGISGGGSGREERENPKEAPCC